jgi:hypothetical protein
MIANEQQTIDELLKILHDLTYQEKLDILMSTYLEVVANKNLGKTVILDKL